MSQTLVLLLASCLVIQIVQAAFQVRKKAQATSVWLQVGNWLSAAFKILLSISRFFLSFFRNSNDGALAKTVDNERQPSKF